MHPWQVRLPRSYLSQLNVKVATVCSKRPEGLKVHLRYVRSFRTGNLRTRQLLRRKSRIWQAAASFFTPMAMSHGSSILASLTRILKFLRPRFITRKGAATTLPTFIFPITTWWLFVPIVWRYRSTTLSRACGVRCKCKPS